LIRKVIPVLLAITVAACIQSCTERIDIDLDESFTRLVVEGAVTTDTMEYQVWLTTTTSYYYPESPPPVQGAYVTLSDGDDTVVMNELSPGRYSTPEDYFGIPGKTYSLHIELAEPIGGYSVYDASSVLNNVNEMDSVKLVFHPDWIPGGMWEVKCYVQEPPTKDWYRFLIYKNHKLFTEEIRYWFVVDDKFFNGSYANGASVSYLRQENPYEKLKVGDTITVEVDNITEEYYNFIMQAQLEVQGTNPMFGGPPANVKGNLSNGAIGFFSAYDRSKKSTITPPF
jgi:hypothetical protein